jgi:hypothetical protein
MCRHEGQIWGNKGPFVITDITGVGFTFHPASLASSRRKCIIPSYSALAMSGRRSKLIEQDVPLVRA